MALPLHNPMIAPPTGTSPISPTGQPGVEAQAAIKVREAVMLLADAVATLKTNLDSDMGKAVLSALKNLAPVAPGVEEGLGQSEIASLISGLKPVRPAPPVGRLGIAQPRPQLQAPPIGGGLNVGR